jgi:ankyrin repeat protein
MKYIKLFENFDAEREMSDFLGYDVKLFNKVNKLLFLSPKELQEWFYEEIKKDEPNWDLIKILETQHGIKFDLGDKDLHWAVMNNAKGLVKYLLYKGENKDAKDKNLKTPLHFAAIINSEAVAKLLIDAGADKEAKDKVLRTPLHYAAKYDSKAVAKLLIDAGADMDATKDDDLFTPLHFAAINGSEGVAKLLIDAGANKYPLDKSGFIPWSYGDVAFRIKFPYLNNKSEINDVFIDELNQSNPDFSKLKDIFRENKGYLTPPNEEDLYDELGLLGQDNDWIMWSIVTNNNEALKFFIYEGENVNLIYGDLGDYWYALHIAASIGNPEIVKTLINGGAKTDLKNSEGVYPFEYADEKLRELVPEIVYNDENIDESSKAKGNRSPINSANIEKALKKKSEKTGVPVSYLRIIMRRGMAAWKSGHRPGAGQQQWGYARLASFLTGKSTTWGSPKTSPKGGADSDVAKQIIKNGHTDGLKFFKKKVNEESEHKYYKGLSQATIEKKKKMMKKQADMPDDDPNAYKELPGDTKGKSRLKISKHIKRFEEMYGDE